MTDTPQQVLEKARQTIVDLRTVLDPFDTPAKIVCSSSAHTISAIDAALAALSEPAAEVQAVDVEAMLVACVPGGSLCDPQQVADAIRSYFAAAPQVQAQAAPASDRQMPAFHDARVQAVYAVLCSEDAPPQGLHWEGWTAQRIVSALARDTGEAQEERATLLRAMERMQEAYNRATPGTWRKGRTSHHTVTDTPHAKGYSIGEFHHAADAEFCDVAHEVVPLLLSRLRALSHQSGHQGQEQ